MVHRHVSRKDPAADAAVAPAYTQRLDLEPIPKYRLPERGAPPEAVYRLIHDELLLDGSSTAGLRAAYQQPRVAALANQVNDIDSRLPHLEQLGD
jgi:glutamate/tyrosine decarboxylase-like PLP-dependent enzyme